MNHLLDMVKEHKRGATIGVYSVCSANALVIEAAMQHAKKHNETLLVEATSNQVNQYGGYTGMTPADFQRMVRTMAQAADLPEFRVVLGGDHLGPNCWQNLCATEAMERSDRLIECYVRAGFRKIHLDCSMSCADDPVPLSDREVAKRAARLCHISEKAWRESGGAAPVYVIGTEVPVPGGTAEDQDVLAATSPEAANTTLDIHYEEFYRAGLEDVWPRIIGLVVQPGVEFGLHNVIQFEPSKATTLSRLIEGEANMLFEAHSTDYQSDDSLAQLVKGHFAILKVGPWLTYVLREACFALECIEQEWIPEGSRSQLKETLLEEMRANPSFWEKYYIGEDNQKRLDCLYSLSDRIRYYWPQKAVQAALDKLLSNLSGNPPPLTLISQYMPEQYSAVRAGKIERSPKALIMHKISLVLGKYSTACKSSQALICA